MLPITFLILIMIDLTNFNGDLNIYTYVYVPFIYQIKPHLLTFF